MDLAAERFLLPQDLAAMLEQAEALWDHAMETAGSAEAVASGRQP
jgi:hypothetical protein